MRKVISIVVMLVFVLSIWGQKQDNTSTEYVEDTISSLNNTKDQAKNNQITGADTVLSAIFNSLDSVMSVYEQINNDYVRKEAQKIITKFIDSYKSAIQSDLSKANATKPEILNNVCSVMIALTVSILSLLLSILALVKINHEHNRISTRKKELEDVERRINQKISEIKPSSFRGTTSSYAPPQPSVPQQKPQQRKAQIPVTPVHREENIQKTKVVERPTISYLYATIKAQSPYAEFFKVATENSGDKVFMLTLASPEADVAEFTIAPNMSADFMKSVIVDRDTYLPSLFCEKSINSSNPTRIEVNAVGRAKKVDGKWQVQKRMIIRLV